MPTVLIATEPGTAARAETLRGVFDPDAELRAVSGPDELLRAVREHAPRLLVTCGPMPLGALPLEWPAGVHAPAVLADLRGWHPDAFDDVPAGQRVSEMRGFARALACADRVLCDDRETRAALAWAARSAGAAWRGACIDVVPADAQEDAWPEDLRQWLQAPQAEARGAPSEPVPAELGTPGPVTRARRAVDLARRALRARLAPHQRGDGVVMVTRGDLFPTDHGAAVKIVETARALSRLGRPVGIVSERRDAWFLFEGGSHREVRYPWRLRLRAWPLAVAKLRHLTRDLPESDAFLYLPLTDRSFRARAAHVAGELDAGVLQAEFPAYADPCLAVARPRGLPVVLVEHNVEYQRLRAQLDELTNAQFERFRAIEVQLASRCDATVCVSDNDRRQLAADGVPPARLHTIPHGVDLAAFEAAAEAGLRARFGIPEGVPLLAFHGTFAYPPNRDALAHFADQLLPRLERRGVEAHVLAIGRQPPARMPHPRIHATGSVEHVGPWLKAADLAVVPLTDGGGTRMKIVDCFAAGVPVVSTAKGIEGIPAVHGREAWIGDDWDAMADAVAEYLQHPGRASEMAGRAREMAASLDWLRIGERYLALYDRL